MAGGTAQAVQGGGVGITVIIKMTAQAAAAQHVIGQLQRCCWPGGRWDMGEGGQIAGGAKGPPGQIYGPAQGKMGGGAQGRHLSGMTGAAEFAHHCGTGGSGYHPLMGLFGVGTVLPGVTLMTRKIMIFI